MMKQTEIFSAIPPELSLEIISAADQYDKQLYKELLNELAKVRKTRLVVIQRMPRTERHPYIIAMLSQPPAASLAFRTIANWLLETQQSMLVMFLDDLGIKHDGKGTVEDIPSEPQDKNKVELAVSRLLATHPRLNVIVYLHSFCAMAPDDWPYLRKILSEKTELKIPEHFI